MSDNREALNTQVVAESSNPAKPKRKYGWFLSDYGDEDDYLNQRDKDGNLLDLPTSYYNSISTDANDVEDLSLLNELLNEINDDRVPFYDAEANALGHLPKKLYMLIPTTCNNESICPLNDVCGRSNNYNKLHVSVLAGVYALAKEQYKGISASISDQIKWAVLRVESFKAGWYNKQPHCTLMEPPKNSVSIMAKDMEEIKKYAPSAWNLSCFIPFLNELCFRSYGSCYNNSVATEYTNRGRRLMKVVSERVDDLSYLPQSVLYGEAFRWIGVQRPMNVLTSTIKNPYIPIVFKVRMGEGPSGQALITSSETVIRSLECVGWWSHIKRVCKYEDEKLLEVADKIKANPWRYHMFSNSYGVMPLTVEERAEVNVVKDFATLASPVLQAYLDTVMKDMNLGDIKVLKKVAQNHTVLYQRMNKFFMFVWRKKPMNLEEAFSMLEDKAQENQGNKT